ncbi:MAG: helix-turn-helix domain-containing protein [Oscillospiraceae bacterium]
MSSYKTNSNKMYSVEHIQTILGIGKEAAYELMKSGQFKIIKCRNDLKITKKSFDEWFETVS